jgi:glutamine amidotransferase
MAMPEILVVDYGVGNLLSVKRALEHLGVKVRLSSDPIEIINANKVILPGVGAFKNAINALSNLGISHAIRESALSGTPILGICLGMQLLFDYSEEFGFTEGLGLIPGKVKSISSIVDKSRPVKVPHIGWSHLQFTQENKKFPLLSSVGDRDAFYFVHSFMAMPSDPANLIATCIYGDVTLPAIVNRGNISGCQFHPEKSGSVGLKMLSNFCHD